MKKEFLFRRLFSCFSMIFIKDRFAKSGFLLHIVKKNLTSFFAGVFLFFCFLFSDLHAHAQDGSLSGKITDAAGKPLAGATVEIKGGSTTKTDERGIFSLNKVPSTKVTLIVTYVGFMDKRIFVSSADGPLIITLTEKENLADEVVVTGVFDKRKRMEASVAISTISSGAIAKITPVSATDLLKNIPGVYVNSSMGEIRNTVYSRGVSVGSNDGAAGFYYVSMQENGLPVTNATYSNYGPDFFLRPDATIGRVEAVRGGTASILGSNSPGGIFNYVMKEGGEKTTGEVSMRYGLEGNGRNNFYRTDVNVGGPMGKNWYWDAGGFYRYDQGHWFPGYPLNNGGQFRANIIKKYKTGTFKIYAKYLNDHNGWQQFIPTVDFQHPKVAAGFNNYSSLSGPALIQDFPINLTGRSETFKTEDQTHNQDKAIGANWEQHLGNGWTLTNAFRYSDKSNIWNTAIHANYVTMNDLVTYSLMGTLGMPGTYSFRNRTTGDEILSVKSLSGYDFNVVSGSTPGSDWAPNSFLIVPMVYTSQKAKEALDQFSLTKRLRNMSFTVGGFYGHSKIDRLNGTVGAGLGLMQDLPELVGVTLTTPANKVYNISNSNGLLSVNGGITLNNATQNQAAFFFGHNWQMTPALNLDWGVRFEHVQVKGANSPGVTTQSTTGGLDGNPLTLYDNGIGSAPQSFAFDRSLSSFSYSAGLNYKINDQFAVYGRVSHGKKAPDLNMYFTVTNDFLAKGLNPIAQDVRQVEGGVKVKKGNLNLFLTPFYSVLSHVPGVQVFTNTDQTQYYAPTVYNKFRTVGVEMETDYNFARHFNIKGVLTVQKGTAVDYHVWLGRNPGPADDTLVSYSGTEQDNLARSILNITPSYNIDKFYAHLTWLYMGKRQANVANAFMLPSFSQFNFSTGYDVSKHINVGLVINNIFNTYGIMSWARPGGIIESLDRQGFTKELYEKQKDRVYTSSSIPPRAYFITGTFKF